PRRCGIKIPEYWHRLSLRSRGQRPCNYCAAEKLDEFPPFHGIYSLLAENHLAKSLIRSWTESYAPHCSRTRELMSALGHKQTSEHAQSMSALPPKADIGTAREPGPLSL